MKAITIWQPWASLIMRGARPAVTKRWNYRSRYPHIEGSIVVVYAGGRRPSGREIMGIKRRIMWGAIQVEIEAALAFFEEIMLAQRIEDAMPLHCGIGTAIIGTPRRINDELWEWPLSYPRSFLHPIFTRGRRDIWDWPHCALSLEQEMLGRAA